MSQIIEITAREILDSRGNPTVQVKVVTELGGRGVFSVPSGASTGSKEALELRDGDKSRFHGKGVLKAVGNVNEVIAPEIIGLDVFDQVGIDNLMIELDGTENKSKLGANAILGVSVAVAKAAADELEIPLYRYIGGTNATLLPTPQLNIINGGEHANNTIDFQEFLLIPIGAKSFHQAVRMASEVFHTLKGILNKNNLETTVGDEGGFAPNIDRAETAFKYMVQAITESGYKAGEDISIGMDAAASEFYNESEKIYDFKRETKAENSGKEIKRTSAELLNYYKDIVKKFPIISIEDGFAEGDWEGFIAQEKEMGDEIQIVGDDIFVTNPKLITEGIARNAANSVLIKLNQIGTLTETIKAVQLAQKHGWTCVVSHRSGETCDTTIADLAVALNTGQIKTGSMSRSERISKYNRLMEIEDELGESARFEGRKVFYNLNKDIK